MNCDKIGNFIQQRRKEKKMTQKDLAEKIGVTDRAVSKWERGHGCPDVSILEILSNELECSVLEILKGRKIENDIISATEADDFVKDSIKISSDITKHKIILIINKIIVVAIIFIVFLLTYLNIVQISYTSQKKSMKISYTHIKDIRNKEDIIEKNLKIIQNNKGKFSNDDYTIISYGLDGMFNNIKNSKLYTYIKTRENITYTINDIIILSEGDVYFEEVNLLKRLEKYIDDDKIDYYRDMVTNERLSSYLSINNLATYKSYQYRLNYSDNIKVYNSENDDIESLIYNMRYDISRIAYLTEIVMEVGEIHE